MLALKIKLKLNRMMYCMVRLVESNLNDNDNLDINGDTFIWIGKCNKNTNNNNATTNCNAICDRFEIPQLNHNISNEDNDSGNFLTTESSNNDINVFDNTFYNNVFYNDFVDKKIEKYENSSNAVACDALVTKKLNASKVNGNNDDNSNGIEHRMSQIENIHRKKH